jgi:ribosomal protein S17E
MLEEKHKAKEASRRMEDGYFDDFDEDFDDDMRASNYR